MQSIFNIRTTYGLPLCLSGVKCHRHLSLSKQIADHDRRREEIKKRVKSETEGVLRSTDLIISNVDYDVDGDDDQSSLRRTSCTAKAA